RPAPAAGESIAGAQAEWRRRTGRVMTAAELERNLRRCLGTVEDFGGFAHGQAGTRMPHRRRSRAILPLGR
ncbi:MAG TPA: hypothetical protein VKP11_00640, partial [Frankiaceae bacterium]|nr:hypothetical protein [Frankiaceae bacterium]